MSDYEAVMDWGRKEYGDQFERAPWNNSFLGLKGKKVVQGKNTFWKYFDTSRGYVDFDTRNYNHTLPLFNRETNKEDDSNARGGKRRTRRSKKSRKTRKYRR